MLDNQVSQYGCFPDVAITSPVPGTTTDVVEKSMELLPLGPVVFLDTAGLVLNRLWRAENQKNR
jgi:predicted GTPase